MTVQGNLAIGLTAAEIAVPATAALPEAPLAMPVQSLEAGGIVGVLRGLFGAVGRAVKH